MNLTLRIRRTLVGFVETFVENASFSGKGRDKSCDKGWITEALGKTLLTVGFCLVAAPQVHAQAVAVTVNVETNQLQIGGTTLLHVLAQVVPADRPSTDRIFSWYVDLLDPVSSVAALDLANFRKTTSDQDPQTSSNGVVDASNLRGVYDTFLNLSAAGRDNPVELFSIPVKAVAPGHARISVQAGTGVPGLAADFIVATLNGGDPLFGGDYSAAAADLEVPSPNLETQLLIASLPLAAGQGVRLTITFPTAAGHDYTVEARNTLAASSPWQALPGAPHNSGSVTDTNSLQQRFYRLRIN
jgi:hypothetical protein